MNPSHESPGASVEAASDRAVPSRTSRGTATPEPLAPSPNAGGTDAKEPAKKEPWLNKWLEHEEHESGEEEAYNYPFTD